MESVSTIGGGKRKRVLLLVYACAPNRGSEPGTGWHRAVEMARSFDTWVICEKKEFEKDIQEYLRAHGPIQGLQFCFVAKPLLGRLLGSLPGFYYLSYNLWHRSAYRAAVSLHKRFSFDIVHQANMCGFREPGYLWRLDAPFIWGPVGGTQNYPWRFLSQAGFVGAIIESLRSVANRLQLAYSPRVRTAVREASVIMAANRVNQRDFETIHGVKPVLFLEIGAQSVVDEIAGSNHGKLRILWSGDFRHHKALHLLIAALGRVPDSFSYELRILGKGPLERRWHRLARRHGIEDNCTWMGFLPFGQAMAQYDWADLFVFSSLRDTAGTVVLEALSKGVPVVCLDHQGAADLVTSRCGVKIPVTTPDRVSDQIRDVIISLGRDRERMESLSRGALDRAREFLWERQADRLESLYRQALADRRVNAHLGARMRRTSESMSSVDG